MNDLEKFTYKYFAEYYREISDFLTCLEGERDGMFDRGEVIPLPLKNEITRHIIIANILAEIGRERYKKEHTELYADGWEFEIEGK